MSIVYAPHARRAAYLMSQQMVSTMISELDPELLPLAKQRKLTRVEGYKEIKGLLCFGVHRAEPEELHGSKQCDLQATEAF